jgi:hypothetical protein
MSSAITRSNRPVIHVKRNIRFEFDPESVAFTPDEHEESGDYNSD